VVERGNGHRLASETFARARVGGHLGRQKLDGDLTIKPGIQGAVHHAHAALAYAGKDLIRAEACAWRKRHVARRILRPSIGPHLDHHESFAACGDQIVLNLLAACRPAPVRSSGGRNGLRRRCSYSRETAGGASDISRKNEVLITEATGEFVNNGSR